MNVLRGAKNVISTVLRIVFNVLKMWKEYLETTSLGLQGFHLNSGNA